MTWPGGASLAVSLTYDDGLPVHRELVAPGAHARGLRVTFYVPLTSPDLLRRPDAWRAVAGLGHEIGNHSVFHPCRGDDPGAAEWLRPDQDLRAYSARRWTEEMAAANLALHLLDGRTQRTFGCTCCHGAIGPASAPVPVGELAADLFTAVRGRCGTAPVDPAEADLHDLGHVHADRRTFDDLRGEMERAAGGWLIAVVHGVGPGTHRSAIDAAEHERLLDYLAERRGEIWTDSVVRVAEHVRRWRAAGSREPDSSRG